MTTLQAAVSGRSATLTVAAAGAGLAMAVYITPITTLAGTATALHAGPDGQAWILSAMALGLVLGLLPSGAVGDDRGRRRMFRAGAGGLAVASALGAVAPDTAWLVAARMGQGLAAGAVLSCSLGMVGHAFAAGPQRARASGLWGAGLGSGMLVGPLLAGGLDAWVGWRGAYWLAAGLAAVLALVARRVPESWSAQRRPADVPGMLLLGAALAALLVALVEARTGWARPSVLVLLAAGTGSGAAFVAVELRRQAPMLDPRLLRRPDFAAATVGALVTGGRRHRPALVPADAGAARPRAQRTGRGAGTAALVGTDRRGRRTGPPAARRRTPASPPRRRPARGGGRTGAARRRRPADGPRRPGARPAPGRERPTAC